MDASTNPSPDAPKVTTTLATGFFCFSLVILLLYSGLETYYDFRTLEAVTSNRQQLIAQEAARAVSGFIEESFSILETCIWLTDLDTLPGEEQKQILQSLLGLRSAFRRLELRDSRHRVLARASRLSIRESVRFEDRLEPAEPLQGRASQRRISPVHIDPVTAEPMVNLAVAVNNVYGDPSGTLIAELNLKFMWDIVDQLKVGRKGYAYVMDRSGNLLAFRDTARVLRGESVSHLEVVGCFTQASSPGQAVTTTQYQGILGTSVVGTCIPLKTPDWAVVIEMPIEEAYQEIFQEIATSAGMTLTVAILAGIFGVLVARRLANPVINLTRTATRIASGERELHASATGPREVAQLAVAFNSMTALLRQSLQDLEQRFSDLKRTEETLRKYERIVSTSQDLMALVNRNYVYEAVNDSFLAAHLRRREEVVGRKVSEIRGEPYFRQRIKDRLDQAFTGQTVRFQSVFDFAGLGQKIMDVTYFPMFDDKGTVEGVVVNARDITETRKLEERLMQSQKIEAIGTLAGGVAHEINNPINGIMNYAQLILDGTKPEDPAGELAQEILHETERVAGIVRNLLTFARHEKQSHSPARLCDIVSSVLSLIQAVMRHDQISLELNIPESLPMIKCRSQQIQQVLMNLMTNGRDALNERYAGFSPEKKLRVSAKIIHRQDRHFIRTTVEDSGNGIPREIRYRIFDPFFTTKPKETGTGLGLSISYGIVRDHGGQLSVESDPGGTTRFHMDLPVDNGWALSQS